MSSFEEGSAPSTLYDMAHGLTGARAMASLMAERHPERSDLLNRFVEGLDDAQKEFIRKVRPELYRQT